MFVLFVSPCQKKDCHNCRLLKNRNLERNTQKPFHRMFIVFHVCMSFTFFCNLQKYN